MSKEDQYITDDPFENPEPHVVILGAGASRAAFPKGDRTGKSLPLLNDLVEAVGIRKEWQALVARASPPGETFEEQFSWCKSTGLFPAELAAIERKMEDYFAGLELPDTPTLYDHLVLGLRPQDVIATFNWDPLLILAHRRNRRYAPLPDLAFLHGCVAYATCSEHDILGGPGEVCPVCKQALRRGPLLFPVANKDYARDPDIKRSWDQVTRRLKDAFHLTIFGYSGPASDQEARELLRKGWTREPERQVDHVEMIDIADESSLRERWAPFITFHHDIVHRDFFESSMARFPRRTAEWKTLASMYGVPSVAHGPFRGQSLLEIQVRARELASHEKKKSARGSKPA